MFKCIVFKYTISHSVQIHSVQTLWKIVYLNTINNCVFEHYEYEHYVNANDETGRIVQVCIHLVKKSCEKKKMRKKLI